MSYTIDETHDPELHSWVKGSEGDTEFPVQNLPYGVYSPAGGKARAGVAIGPKILDLAALAKAMLLPPAVTGAAQADTLNALMCLPLDDRLALRRRLSALLCDKAEQKRVEPLLSDAQECVMHLPAAIGDYTDFYVGIHHAENVGRIFRPDNPLLPNYKHVPIGYHGRASSVRPSGAPVVRPRGQIKAPDAAGPGFGPSKRLDYELEIGVWIGQGNGLAEPISIHQAQDYIAGYCLLNDWSARDIQAWEYQPLGPFLSKNFQTSISPWVVTSEAMAPFYMAQPARPKGDPRPLDYLWDLEDQARGALSITLQVELLTSRMRETGLQPRRLAQGPASNMYWTAAQIVTHHTSGGCNLNPGDLLGTGTISAPDAGGYGSMFEMSQGGARPLSLENGETRSFLEDGDEVILRGTAHATGRVSIGFGECRALVLPSPCR